MKKVLILAVLLAIFCIALCSCSIGRSVNGPGKTTVMVTRVVDTMTETGHRFLKLCSDRSDHFVISTATSIERELARTKLSPGEQFEITLFYDMRYAAISQGRPYPSIVAFSIVPKKS